MDFLELFQTIPAIAMVLFGIGVVLLVIEMCAPGFGIAGVSAIICFALSIIFAADTLLEGLVLTGIVLVVIAVIVVVFLILLSRGKLSSNFILKTKNSGDEGFSSAASDLAFLIGQTGVAQTTLRPAGRVLIGGRVYDVVTSGDFIASGSDVKVCEVNGNHIVVTPAVLA